jgi:hypothetical protein
VLEVGKYYNERAKSVNPLKNRGDFLLKHTYLYEISRVDPFPVAMSPVL